MSLLPRSFLWRTILMILVPLVIAMTIIANVFFDNHWSRVHSTMARSLSGEIVTMMNFLNANKIDAMQDMAQDIGIKVSINDSMDRPQHNDNSSREAGRLSELLERKLDEPTNIYVDKANRSVSIDVPAKNGKIATFDTSLYRLYSTSTEVFVLWLIGSLLIVSFLVSPFILLHTRSIRRIADAANKFGRGLDDPNFKPSGSKEIREAASAMIKMKERLNRYNRTRTDMLNAVSHDLKSPLARMRLAIETDTATKSDLLHNIDRMSEMINGYLAFARGEMPEIEQATELPSMLLRMARDAAPNKNIVSDFPEAPVQFYARPMALARAFGNIIENAAKYANNTIKITEHDYPESVEVIIEDDGPGIPDAQKNDALRPFVRLDEARSESTGGTGLGLSIAKTAIENHGGEIFLEDSSLGGLRVRVVLPI